MAQNAIHFVKTLGELVRPEIFSLDALNDISESRNKMDSIKDKFAQDHGANLNNLKQRVTGEIARPDGLSNKDRNQKALTHWFSQDKGEAQAGFEQILAARLKDAERRSAEPQLESMPSSEDSWLAWTSEDEHLFDRPVKQMWKDYDDEQTALVKVDYIDQREHFDAQPGDAPVSRELSQDEVSQAEYLERIDVGTAVHGGNISLNYWI